MTIDFRSVGFTDDAINHPRDDVSLTLFAAFNGVRVDQLPEAMRYFPNEATAKAWKRVADAALMLGHEYAENDAEPQTVGFVANKALAEIAKEYVALYRTYEKKANDDADEYIDKASQESGERKERLLGYVDTRKSDAAFYATKAAEYEAIYERNSQ